MQFSHYNESSKERRIPDFTLGLCTYDLHLRVWRSRQDLANNDRISLFDGRRLAPLLEHFHLQAPHKKPKKRTMWSPPIYPFVLWEAKMCNAKENHQHTFHQTAPRCKQLLVCQEELYEKAQLCSCPLVWFFSSVGPSWQIYAGYVEKGTQDQEISTNRKSIYVSLKSSCKPQY